MSRCICWHCLFTPTNSLKKETTGSSFVRVKKSIWQTFLICFLAVVVLIAVSFAYLYYELHTSFKLFFPLGPPSYPFQRVSTSKDTKSLKEKSSLRKGKIPCLLIVHYIGNNCLLLQTKFPLLLSRSLFPLFPESSLPAVPFPSLFLSLSI